MALLSTFLKDQLEKPSEDSKKWRMAMIGLKGVAVFFGVGAVMVFVKPALAGYVVTMVQFTVAAWGGIVALFLGAQGSVDFRTTAALQNIQQTETREEHIEQTIRTEGGAKAFDEEGLVL